MKIKPLYDKVLIQLIDEQHQSSSGIIIPEDAQTKSHIAKVIAVGEGKFSESGQLIKPKVKKGQKVLIRGEWAGDNVKVEGIEYKVISDSDILAIVEQ